MIHYYFNYIRHHKLIFCFLSMPNLIIGLLFLDKKTRDKAVKVLERWLSSKQDISELDLKKIWKALFYCKLIYHDPITIPKFAFFQAITLYPYDLISILHHLVTTSHD